MTGTAALHAHGSPVPLTTLADSFTQVELIWLEKRIEHWIRFGHDVEDRILDRRRRVLAFPPDSVFAFIRWAANDYGTVSSHVDILRAVHPGQPYQTLPFVRPGGEILLHLDGWPKVEQVLQMIDAIEAAGIDPAEVSPDHWRHVHNRLTAHQEPRRYSPTHHRAFLLRRRATP